MIPLLPHTHCDLLDEASLPPSQNNELNYRTQPLTADEELRLTLLVMLTPIPCALIGAGLVSLLIAVHPFFTRVFQAAILVAVGRLAFAQLTGALTIRWFLVSLALGVTFTLGCIWGWLDSAGWNLVAILANWLTVALIAQQVATWILVGPTVERDTMQRWSHQVPRLWPGTYSLECPELLTMTVSPLLLGPLWWLSIWISMHELHQPWLRPWLLLVLLVVASPALHLLLSPLVPWPDWRATSRAAWRALTVFLTYDLHETRAGGVFRFPVAWLRPVWMRWLLVIGAEITTAFACATVFPQYPGAVIASMSPAGAAILSLFTASLMAPVLLAAILWFVAGPLLARFERELSGPAPSGATPWDIYADRIVNSQDALEREHLFVGSTIQGDLPVLLHRDVFDQHAHILGDSGASKSSLGVGPLATQLIARGDATVIVIDLKGDKALFEACLLESARTRRLRFRWLTNEVGKSTFAFNPFLQSHNSRMSATQFTQYLLQGLSLDYGTAYGAGYFTAMNELVLRTSLQHGRARSFRELAAHLNNSDWYSRFGESADWEKARHLVALIDRMSEMEAINVVPGMYPDLPEVHRQSIDATEVLNEPQVLYVSLKSALEPSNTASLARLLLWTLFNAAGQRPQGSRRSYIFIDEAQLIINQSVSLLFEQFRDLGGTLIAVHQTASQLKRDGADLTNTVDACTAVKQVFRASDLDSLDRLEKLSGTHWTRTASWEQPRQAWSGNLVQSLDPMHAIDEQVKVREAEEARLSRSRILRISSHPLASTIRFTFGRGYTQFAGQTVPIYSQFPISFGEYTRRRGLAWPTASGTFAVPGPAQREGAA